MSGPTEAIDNNFESSYYNALVSVKREENNDWRVQSFAYIPQPLVLTQTPDKMHGTYLPSQQMMVDAFKAACYIKEQELPERMKAKTYSGVDINNMPSSKELTQAGKEGRVVLQDCIFDDFLSAEYYRSALRPDKHNHDPTIPMHTAAQKLHVQLLVQAFKNHQDCEDNPPMIKPFIERRHDSKLVEVICWGVLKAIIMRSNSDEPLLVAYDATKAKNSQGINNFAERFDAVATHMAKSKTMCKHLYDPPYVNTLVDNPIHSNNRINSNRVLNRQKGQIMGKGKKALEAENLANGIIPQTKPRKRRATTMDAEEPTPTEGESDRRSLIVNLPIARNEEQISPSDGTFPMMSTFEESKTPSSSSFRHQSSPNYVKQETESPGLVPRRSLMTPFQPTRSARTSVDQEPNYNSFNSYQGFGYGNQTGFDSYGANMHGHGYGNSYGSNFDYTHGNQYGNPYLSNYGSYVQNVQENQQFLHRQAQSSHQPGFVYHPPYDATSHPTTPIVPCFSNTELSSNPEPETPTPTGRGFNIPDELTPPQERQELFQSDESDEDI